MESDSTQSLAITRVIGSKSAVPSRVDRNGTGARQPASRHIAEINRARLNGNSAGKGTHPVR